MRSPILYIDEILAWADAHFARTGSWPGPQSGPIPESGRDTWRAVDAALSRGGRGLPCCRTLAQLLHFERSTRYFLDLPKYSAPDILDWANAHHARTGEWPHEESGEIAEFPGETWAMVGHALERGRRGLTGGTTLGRLLYEHYGVRSWATVPDLTRQQILAWADAHFSRTGQWPTGCSGPIPEAPGETWARANAALSKGDRGLEGGDSVAKLLAAERNRRHGKELPRLTEDLILDWADALHAREGRWPVATSGEIADSNGETWMAVHTALSCGYRGLPGGSTLRRLLVSHRGIRHPLRLPALTHAQILVWAAAHHAGTGRWPSVRSGAIEQAPGETWSGIDHALMRGTRGLPGGESLPRLLASHTPRRN